jgi:hypothetical protein
MAKLFPIVSGLMLAGIFVFAIISFGLNVAINNNPEQTIGNDDTLNDYYSNLQTNLSTSLDTANAQETALGQDPTTDTGDNLLFPSIKGSWKSVVETPKAVFSITFGLLMSKLFPSDEFGIIFIVIAGLITVAISFAVWRMVFTGDSG